MDDNLKPPGRRRQLYAVDTFSGAGLFGLGFAVEGFNIGQVCEIDPEAVQTLRNLHPEAKPCDATQWTPRVPRQGIDVLYGGPPCQTVSQAGHGQGSADIRYLFDEFPRWMAESKPRIAILENVRGLLGKNHKADLRRWWREVKKAGYEGAIWHITAADYGTPQLRPRIFIVTWPKGAPWGERLQEPPPPTHAPPDVAEQLGLIPYVSAYERLLLRGCCGGFRLYSCMFTNNADTMCDSCVDGANYAVPLNDVAEESEAGLSPGGVFIPGRDRSYKRFPMDDPDYPGRWYQAGTDEMGEISLGTAAMLIRDPDILTSSHGLVNLAEAPRWERKTKCLWLSRAPLASYAKGVPAGLVVPPGATFRHGGPKGDYEWLRRLTVRQVAKLMDVPSWFLLRGSVESMYRQLGNGVPVNVARAVARHLTRAFGREPVEPGAHPERPLSWVSRVGGFWTYETGVGGCSSYNPPWLTPQRGFGF